jgi:hypothetical protein
MFLSAKSALIGFNRYWQLGNLRMAICCELRKPILLLAVGGNRAIKLIQQTLGGGAGLCFLKEVHGSEGIV